MNVTVPPITPGSLRRVFSKKLSLVPGFLDAEAKPIWFTTSILAMPGATSVALIVSTDRSCLSPWSSDAFSQAQAGSVIRRIFTRGPPVMDQFEALDCALLDGAGTNEKRHRNRRGRKPGLICFLDLSRA
jgi:hypothetical protein